MYKLVVLYPHPADPQAFLDYYHRTHLPLASKLPGIVSMSFGQPKSLAPGPSPYFGVFEGVFEDEQALFAALKSPEGKAVAADVVNYSPLGATLLRVQMEPVAS